MVQEKNEELKKQFIAADPVEYAKAQAKKDTYTPKSVRESLIGEREKCFKCSKCGKEFYSLDGLAWHVTRKCENGTEEEKLFTKEEMIKAVQYGFWYATESQHHGEVPMGNIKQWLRSLK